MVDWTVFDVEVPFALGGGVELGWVSALMVIGVEALGEGVSDA